MRVSLLFLIAILSISRAAEPLAGRWEGQIQVPGDPIRIVIDLDQSAADKQDKDKQWRGSAILPGLGIKGTLLSEIAVHGADADFKAKDLFGGATFHARVTSGNRLAGDYTQGGNRAPFNLQLAGAPQVDEPARSTPVSKELEGVWSGEMTLTDYPVAVRLTLSNGPAGTATAQIFIKGKRETNVTADLFTEEQGLITATGAGAGYEGRFDVKSGVLSGTFTTGPLEASLNLRREK